MSRTAAPSPPEHRLELPPGTTDVVGVFVNGIELRPGEDYEIGAGHLRLRRSVRLARPLTGRDLLRIALCVEVVPGGDSVDVIVRRGGALTTLQIAPGPGAVGGGGRDARPAQDPGLASE